MSDFDGLTEEEQIEKMREWFYENYEDPAERTPYEGEYIWIYGGPYDAYEELLDKFEGQVDERLILDLADDLNSECTDWTSTSDEGFYDEYFNNDPIEALRRSLEKFRSLSSQQIPDQLKTNFYALLFINCITIMEVFLSDTFINEILIDQNKKVNYLRSDPYFKERSLKYSDLYDEYEKIDDLIKYRLSNIVWHKLNTVRELYKDALGVDIKDFIRLIEPKVVLRHHIAHRNGKNKEGEDILVDLAQLNELADLVDELASYIEGVLRPIVYPTEF